MIRKTLIAIALGSAAIVAAPTMATATTATTGLTYTYQTSLTYNGITKPVTLTINTANGTATYTGSGINMTFTGASLKNFQGGTSPANGTFVVTSVTGSMTFGTKTYTPYASTYPKTTSLVFTSSTDYLWTYAKDKWGRNYDLDLKTSLTGYQVSSTGGTTTTSGGTTTGGTTTGGTTTGGTTTGGTTTGGTTTGGTTTGGTTTGGTTTGGTTTGGTTTGGTTSGGGSTGGTPVPAPGAALLFGLGAAGIIAGRRRRAKR